MSRQAAHSGHEREGVACGCRQSGCVHVWAGRVDADARGNVDTSKYNLGYNDVL